MARFKLSQCVYRISVAIVTLLPFCMTVVRHGQLEQREKRNLLASTEIPVEYIDPASIDLTPLVNTLINATHTGSQHLFSVLSVTSHSSLALHKLTLLVYNISDFQDIETSAFPMRYCYCVTNKTNDLTDFTAILLDVMGNSTTYLQELFKSSSILSVSQRNSSDCIYICVMAGKTDRDLSRLWDSVVPLFNHTIIEDTHKATLPSAVTMTTTPVVVSTVSEHSAVAMRTVETSSHMTTVQSTSESTATTIPVTTVPSSDSVPITTTALMTAAVTTAVSETTTGTGVLITTEPPTTPTFSAVTRRPPHVSRTTTASAVSDTAIKTPPTVPATQPSTDSMTTSPATTKGLLTDKPGCPWRSELFYKGSQREDLKETLTEDLNGNSPTVSAIKLQPCVFELCKFFSQCLCRGYSHKTFLQSYCTDSHVWYEKHTVEVCSRVRRVAFSRNLKQRCLARMCVKK